MAQLCQNQTAFQKRNTRVIIVSFGTLPAVQVWLQDTCATFSVLLDRNREVYAKYGLERSFWRSRNLKTRWYYFRAWMTGKKTHDSHGDDTSQLGGNFIVDKEGVLRLIYPSHDPTDRPAVESLLKILDDLE